ncbi:MAG: adenine phosphoribosyltransferase [Coriobacteriia bacterium]|nr:adenine phosphoribosyltransferase [Coriobacteriia bacterium]
MAEAWPECYTVEIDESFSLRLPLITDDKGFSIYVLDLMGQVEWNKCVAASLYARLQEEGHEFDIILTAEAKAIALAEELAACFGHSEYVVLRKSPKLYMQKPIVVVEVQSITTKALQHFYLGRDKADLLKGKRVCVLDDVVSTGGTMRAIFNVADEIGSTISVIATVLTEGESYHGNFAGVPLISLGIIPLPGFSKVMPE